MKFSTTLLVGALASLATAAPATTTTLCLSVSPATKLVTGFASLLTAYKTSTAESLLAADFTDTSDSINWLSGQALGRPTFNSKKAFEQGQGTQPAIGFTVLSIDAITCNTVAFRWAASLGKGTTPIKGINILNASNLNNTLQGWQIRTMYSEFNSGLWKQELCHSGAIPKASCTLS